MNRMFQNLKIFREIFWLLSHDRSEVLKNFKVFCHFAQLKVWTYLNWECIVNFMHCILISCVEQVIKFYYWINLRFESHYFILLVLFELHIFSFRQAFPSQHESGQTIRLIFQGRVLNGDTYPLRYLGIMNGHVIHTSISDQPSSNQTQPSGAEDELGLDFSALFVPLVAAMFSLLWTFVYFYSWLFSATSLLILGFLTLLFAAMTFLS